MRAILVEISTVPVSPTIGLERGEELEITVQRIRNDGTGPAEAEWTFRLMAEPS